MAEQVRRSSRIPKQIPILVVGSDMEGRVFSEQTKTVVLSRHGAGLVSEYPLSAEQELVVRIAETGKEADVRVVGQLGAVEGGYLYGVAFLDAKLVNFWGIDFPVPTESEKEAGRKVLECISCKGREVVQQMDVEADVFAINQGLMRYCQRCGTSTIWKQAVGDVTMEPVAQAAAPARAPDPPSQVAPADIPQPADGPASVTLEAVTPDLEPSPQATTAYSSDAVNVSGSVAPEPKEQARTAATSSSPAAKEPTAKRQENRRKHVRTRVTFKACVRYQDYPEDIVTCEDMSRGGLRFKSSRKYPEKANIEVAAPYQPGAPGIFVAAQIVHAQENAAKKTYSYGVMYMRNR